EVLEAAARASHQTISHNLLFLFIELLALRCYNAARLAILTHE
ncbi:MAG: hypothetical protein HW376_1648, partial [candidate division NC10 bacterium]|nr:hypothetical protein [candidate division NC10 bacterium]